MLFPPPFCLKQKVYRGLRLLCWFLLGFVLLTPGFSITVSAEGGPTPQATTATETGVKYFRKVSLSLSLSIPPYILTDSSRGAELDIVREAMALEGYEISTHYVPNKRRNIDYSRGNTDGVLTISKDEQLPGYYTQSYITYQNVAISLKNKAYQIQEIPDLQGKRVIAFQTASVVLGAEFADFTSNNKSYFEHSRQLDHLAKLFGGHIDVVVGDINILNWLVKNGGYSPKINKDQPLTVHSIFSPDLKYAVFHDAEITQAFDRGIAALKKSGRYDVILKEYDVYRGQNEDLLREGT